MYFLNLGMTGLIRTRLTSLFGLATRNMRTAKSAFHLKGDRTNQRTKAFSGIHLSDKRGKIPRCLMLGWLDNSAPKAQVMGKSTPPKVQPEVQVEGKGGGEGDVNESTGGWGLGGRGWRGMHMSLLGDGGWGGGGTGRGA